MDTVVTIIQVIIALGILNVWIVRFGKSTSWRGGEAQNMKEEFEVYGMPDWAMPVVGFLKVVLAVALVAGIWIPGIAKPAAWGMAVLMLGAISMHVKVSDPLQKSLPAFIMLVLSLVVAVA
jgi:hypothetical protein